MSTNIIKPSTQVNNISIYDDSKPLNASLQTDATSLEDDIQGVLSVLNAIKDATLTGKWYDDLFEVNSKKRGIKQLNVDLNTLEIEVANLIIENQNYYLVSASFNTSTGLLTMTLNNGVNVTVNLDGRYLTGIADESITNPKLAHIDSGTVKGRTTAGTGDVEDLNIETQLKPALNLTKNDVGLSNVQNVDTTDASNIADGSVSNTRFQYLSNVTSDIQAQINGLGPSKYLVSANFDTLDGVLTLTLNDTTTITASFDGRYLTSLIEDTSPQLGGNLFLNNNDILGTGNIQINGEIEANLHIGPLRGEICFNAKAGEALTKGDPVYISNYDTVGNTPVVGIADADDANKMPSFGLAKENASLNASVTVVTFGTLDGINTSSFNLGDILYISTTGTLTNQPPTGETALIQNIGKVMRSHATNGSVKVGGAGRSNDTPNLNDGNVFIGNASNQAESRALTLDDVSETSTKKILTDSERTKLQGIQAGAEVNVNADWNATTGDALIENKPTDITNLSIHSVTELSDVTSAGSGAIITNQERSDIQTNNAKITNATHTGDVIGSQALTISNNAVDNNKLADMAQGTVKARTNVGTGDPQDVDISTTLKSALGLVKNDVGLSNVQNVDQTNASNITTGTLDIDSGNFKVGLNVGYSGTTTDDRINLGDSSFYFDRSNANLPLINWDSNDYLSYNRTNNALSMAMGGIEELKLTTGVNYPTLTMRGQAVLNEADRTVYGTGYDLNNFMACGIYVIGALINNLPPQRDTNESSYVLHVYTWGSQNGIQILYCTDRDAANKHNAIYSRCWESTLWTDWNCVSSTPEELCDVVVSIGLTYTNFTVNEDLSTIATRYKQVLIMYESSAYAGSMILDGPTIDINQNWEIGKYSTRSINFKTPTSSSSTTWQAAASGVTLTRIKMVGYR